MKPKIVKFICESFENRRDLWHSCKDPDCDFHPLYHYQDGEVLHLFVDPVVMRQYFSQVFQGKTNYFSGPIVLHSDRTQDEIYSSIQDPMIRDQVRTAPNFFRPNGSGELFRNGEKVKGGS